MYLLQLYAQFINTLEAMKRDLVQRTTLREGDWVRKKYQCAQEVGTRVRATPYACFERDSVQRNMLRKGGFGRAKIIHR